MSWGYQINMPLSEQRITTAEYRNSQAECSKNGENAMIRIEYKQKELVDLLGESRETQADS